MKKAISLLIAIVLLMSFALPASAIEIQPARSELVTEVEKFIFEAVYPNNDYTLSSVSSISLGSEIPTYIVGDETQDNLVVAEVRYYPVLSNFNVIGLLGVYENNGQYNFSYSEGNTDLISDALGKSKEIALVWKNTRLQVLTPSEASVTFVGTANDVNRIQFKNPLETCTELSLIPSNAFRAYPNSASVSVPTKLQTYDWDCWAACTACIGQFHTGLNYTSLYVANEMNYNHGGKMPVVIDALDTIYKRFVSYDKNPSYKTICDVIYNRRNPIGAGLIIPNGSPWHMVVIYGYTTGSSYSSIMIMEPSSGKTTISLSNVDTTDPHVPMSLVLGGITYQIWEFIY